MFVSWANEEKQHLAEEIHQVYLELSTYCNLTCKTCVRNSVTDFKNLHIENHVFDCVIDSLKDLHSL